MSGEGGRGGFNPGRGGFNPGRGGYGGGRGNYGGRGDFGGGRGDFGGGRGDYGPGGGRGDYGSGRAGYGAGRGGYGNNRAEFVPRGRYSHAAGRGNAGYSGGRGYQGNGYGGFGGSRNFVQGESSGLVGAGSNGNWDNSRYGGNQQRWSTGRGGAMVNRNRGQEAEGSLRGGIDADLLQQTVQAVVAAVTAATKTKDAPVAQAPVVAQASEPVAVAAPVVEAPASEPQQLGMSHVITEGTETDATVKENEGQGATKKKKEDKAGCFRCKKPGHYIDDCPAPFCDICESIHHVTAACHMLNAPKPTAILHGYANEGLMFFELACGVFKAKAENPKLAKVTVEGDTLTIPEIIEQLKKIVPSEKFNWEVFHFKDNIYRVKLPSKLEVQRLKNFGTYICTNKEACLAFDSRSSVEEPLHMLPEVWVRVSGLPSDVRSDYLTLWGVGTLFGKTLDVDMAYTRKNKVLRTKIGCLDHRLIPADSDMFIRRGFYKLRFEVEIEEQSQEVNMVDANNGSDGNNGDSLHRAAASGLVGVGIDALGQQPAIGQVLPDAVSAQHAASRVPSAGRQRPGSADVQSPVAVSSQHAANGLLSDGRQLLSGPADVRSPGDGGPGSSELRKGAAPAAASSPVTQRIQHAGLSRSGHRSTYEAGLGPMIGVRPGGLGSAVYHNAVAHVVSAGVSLSGSLGQSKRGFTKEVLAKETGDVSSLGKKGSVGVASSTVSTARPTMEEVIAFGGIPQPSLDVRTSARLGGQPGGDMLQMEKAMRNAQLRDGASSIGNSLPPKFSIVNMPDDEIMHKAESLGISLGKSEGEVVKTIKGIKLLEEERILTILQNNVEEYVNKEEDPSTFVMSKVSTLCDDLVEDDCIPLDLDDQLEHLNTMTYPWESYQLGSGGDPRFEKELKQLVDYLGHPYPEFFGIPLKAQLGEPPQWDVSTDLRRKLDAPVWETIWFSVTGNTWKEGLDKAMQEAISRLCGQNEDKIKNTRFIYYPRHDSMGRPMTMPPPQPKMNPDEAPQDFRQYKTRRDLDNALASRQAPHP
ncbi:hypothetical protein QYE76_023985 [Lolium multiflorum]|uniref:CCHC-type domain-containing protein n=1 Tax=Lolium multiflorum TaxID=4521 RepID=A0AAD8VVK9_LOLMU|nr:hypothetical protein QYE76_023985 [Lolium multiflorum]